MKYSILLLILFLFSCGPNENSCELRRVDSAYLADSLAMLLKKEKSTTDSFANSEEKSQEELNACPKLKPYFTLSHHIGDLSGSDENAEALHKKYKQLSDSLIVMETEIFAHTYKDLDRSCQELFLDRMKKNAAEISDGFNRKVYTK
jgi:hypothetical protein